MTIYYILLAVTALAAYPLCKKSGTAGKIAYLTAVFGFMVVMASLRYGIGNDYFHYYDRMVLALDQGYSLSEAFTKLDTEPGYALLVMLVGTVFPRSVQYLALNCIMALICIVPVAVVIGRYSKMPWLSAWLYICLVFFYNTMNFTRASAAAAIVFLAYPFMRDRKHIPAVLLILVACTFHLSAAVMLPVYFLSLIKLHKIITPVISAVAVICFVFSRQIINFAVTNVFTHYKQYAGSIYVNNGLSIAFMIVPTIMLASVLGAYLSGWKEREGAPMLTNFALYSFFAWLFSMKHFVVERFSLPIYIFMLLAVPDIICWIYDKRVAEGKGKKDSRKLKIYITAAVYIFSSCYNYYCMSSGVHGVFPYRSVFNPAIVDKERLSKYPRECYVNVSLTSFLYTAGLTDCSVFAVYNGKNIGSTDIIQQMYFNKLGFNADLSDRHLGSYIGAASGGATAFERTGSGRLEETVSLYEGKYVVELVSDQANGFASAKVNGREFITQGNGMFFIVFDNKKQCIATVQGYNIARYHTDYIHSSGFDGLWSVPGFEDFEVDFG